MQNSKIEKLNIPIEMTIEDGYIWFCINGDATLCNAPSRSFYKTDEEWKIAFMKELKEICTECLFESIKDSIDREI